MRWLRMGLVALRLAGPCLLAPWRSPLLRWRIETYGVTDDQGRLLHADDITAVRFVRFLLMRRRALLRFLAWAATL